MLSGLYYKHKMIVNYASSSINKLKASLNDDTTVIIYDCHMFVVGASDLFPSRLCQQGGIRKDPTVLATWSKTTTKYVFKNNMSSMKSKI